MKKKNKNKTESQWKVLLIILYVILIKDGYVILDVEAIILAQPVVKHLLFGGPVKYCMHCNLHALVCAINCLDGKVSFTAEELPNWFCLSCLLLLEQRLNTVDSKMSSCKKATFRCI